MDGALSHPHVFRKRYVVGLMDLMTLFGENFFCGIDGVENVVFGCARVAMGCVPKGWSGGGGYVSGGGLTGGVVMVG